MAVVKTDEGTYKADFRDPTGKRIIKRFKRKQDAEDYEEEMRRQVRGGEYITVKKTFGDVADMWLEKKRQQEYAYGSMVHWTVHVSKHLKPTFGSEVVTEMGIQQIEAMTDKWLSKLAPKTVNKILTTMEDIFDLALRYDYVKKNIISLVERKRIPEADRRVNNLEVRPDEVYSFEECARLFEAAALGMERALIMTPVLTGPRVGEIQALQWDDLDLKAGKVTIRRSISESEQDDNGNQVFKSPKTKHGYREIPIPRQYASELRQWKIQCPASPYSLVFCQSNGMPLDRKGILKTIVEPAMRRAKLKILTVHQLRHTFASHLLINGASPIEVCYYMGHSSPKVTMDIYAHWCQRIVTDSIARAADRIFSEEPDVDQARTGRKSA